MIFFKSRNLQHRNLLRDKLRAKMHHPHQLNPRTYTQIHTPTVVQGEWMDPSPPPPVELLLCCSISKRFYLQWKAFDLLYKMRYILWLVALLGACDVTNNGRNLSRHLGFYQELIRV